MSKIIFAAALVVAGAAYADSHAKGKKAAPATTTTTTTQEEHKPMTAADAEKACKAEKATDMKTCVASKTHSEGHM